MPELVLVDSNDRYVDARMPNDNNTKMSISTLCLNDGDEDDKDTATIDHQVISLPNPFNNNNISTTNNSVFDLVTTDESKKPNDQDILDLVHKLCTNIKVNSSTLLIQYFAVRKGYNNKMVNQSCLLPFLSNETKIEIRSLILDTFEKQQVPLTKLKKVIELLLTNGYKQDSKDEEIFRFGIIKWFNSITKSNKLISTSIIDSVLVALSKIKQPCHSTLVFETLDTIYNLLFKSAYLGEREILMFLSIFKHYQFKDNEQQVQLKQDITNSIYKHMMDQSHLLENKEFQLFFKQTIGILFQSAYDGDYFIPQQMEQDYDRFIVDWNYGKDQYEQRHQIRRKSRFEFLKRTKLTNHTICTIILDYLKELLNETPTPPTWKEKLIVLGVLNLVSSQYEKNSPFLNSNLLESDEEDQDNVLLQYEFLRILSRISDSSYQYISSFRRIVNKIWKSIFNNKQKDPVHPRILYNLCAYLSDTNYRVLNQDLIDQVFEISLISDQNPFLVKHSQTLLLKNPHLVSERLAPIFFGFLDTLCLGESEINSIIGYFESLHTSTTTKTRLTTILLSKPPALVEVYLMNWVLDGSIGKNANIYLPAIIKVITTKPIDDYDKDRMYRLCNQFADKIYPYVDRLIPWAIKLYNNENTQDRAKLLICLFSIHSQFRQTDQKQQQSKTNQLFQQLLDLFTIEHGENSDRKIKSVKRLIKHAKQKDQLLKYSRNNRSDRSPPQHGIQMIHNMIRQQLDPRQFGTLQNYSDLIYQLKKTTTTSFDYDQNDCDQYLEIGIYHVEQMLDNIKNNNAYISELVSSISYFHQLLQSTQFSCQANNIWSNHFNKYLMANITNPDTLQSLLFLTQLKINK
ncbi:hypothetical protein DFA_10407 [Cavenderia fasciculata]|uniref:Uncharacterized protein n=1 Tax=Cavenderia fasciculata TaxID=261658 RepID=F4QA46_CACFS|nr:uncharacterized protein DFA_10407 [Cavenderia fasciculata]EGG15565.1 hypothetical protein DFA_10407 [Cavenderia fasciculata]|eukprot:XP_004354307.1 hypothetical protein DFA_10407 [Cavenderia fasciculata]